MMNRWSFWVLCIHNSLYCCLSEAGAYIFCCLGSFQFEQLVNNSSEAQAQQMKLQMPPNQKEGGITPQQLAALPHYPAIHEERASRNPVQMHSSLDSRMQRLKHEEQLMQRQRAAQQKQLMEPQQQAQGGSPQQDNPMAAQNMGVPQNMDARAMKMAVALEQYKQVATSSNS
jgi:hypothetical protein